MCTLSGWSILDQQFQKQLKLKKKPNKSAYLWSSKIHSDQVSAGWFILSILCPDVSKILHIMFILIGRVSSFGVFFFFFKWQSDFHRYLVLPAVGGSWKAWSVCRLWNSHFWLFYSAESFSSCATLKTCWCFGCEKFPHGSVWQQSAKYGLKSAIPNI